MILFHTLRLRHRSYLCIGYELRDRQLLGGHERAAREALWDLFRQVALAFSRGDLPPADLSLTRPRMIMLSELWVHSHTNLCF